MTKTIEEVKEIIKQGVIDGINKSEMFYPVLTEDGTIEKFYKDSNKLWGVIDLDDAEILQQYFDTMCEVNYGDGNEIYIVLKIDEETFVRFEGTYSSWVTTSWYDMKLVQPTEITIIKYLTEEEIKNGRGDDAY